MDKALKKELEKQPQNFRRLIEEYCRLESVATQNRMMRETADWVEGLLKESGFDTRQLDIEGAPNYIYGEMKGRSDFTLLLYNHYDVQPEDPVELWESPPFEVTNRDDKLFARGIADNKAELIARICAINAILAIQGGLPITIKWIIEGEEEIGSPHFSALIKEHSELFKSDYALWEGWTFAENGQARVNLGCRGLVYVEYSIEAIKRDAHSGMASFLPSAAWRLVKALSSLRDNGGKILIPGFYDDARDPTKAEKEAMRNSVDLDLEDKWLELFGIDSFKENKRGYEFEKLVFEPTANIAGFLSGYTQEGVKTVLPAKAMAKMDFRLVPDQNPDDIFEKLKDHLKTQGFEDVQVRKLGGTEPMITPIESDFAQRIVKICNDFTGKETRINSLTGGTLPLLEAMKKNAGILGVSTVGNPVYYGSSEHAPNEHIRLKDVAKAIEFNAFLLENMSG